VSPCSQNDLPCPSVFFSLFVSPLQNNLSPVLSKNVPSSSPFFLCNLLPCPSVFYFFSLKNNLLSKSPSAFYFFFSLVSKTISLVPNHPLSFHSPLCNLFVFFKIFFPLFYPPPPLVFIRGRGRGPPYLVMIQGKMVGATLSNRPRDVCRAWPPSLFFIIVAGHVGIWVVLGLGRLGGERERAQEEKIKKASPSLIARQGKKNKNNVV